MKNVLVILAGSLLATTAKAQMPSPVDSLKISKDVSLDEVGYYRYQSRERDPGSL